MRDSSKLGVSASLWRIRADQRIGPQTSPMRGSGRASCLGPVHGAGDRQTRRMSWLDQNDVTPVLAVLEPVGLLESPHGPLSGNGGQRRHLDRNLDFADLTSWRHAVGCTGRKATSDCFTDIVESLGFGPSLRDAAGDRRALDYEHADFVRLRRHEELHTQILSRCGGNSNVSLSPGPSFARMDRPGGLSYHQRDIITFCSV